MPCEYPVDKYRVSPGEHLMIRNLRLRQLFTGVLPTVFVIAPIRKIFAREPPSLALVNSCELIPRAVSARTKALRWARMLA